MADGGCEFCRGTKALRADRDQMHRPSPLRLLAGMVFSPDRRQWQRRPCPHCGIHLARTASTLQCDPAGQPARPRPEPERQSPTTDESRQGAAAIISTIPPPVTPPSSVPSPFAFSSDSCISLRPPTTTKTATKTKHTTIAHRRRPIAHFNFLAAPSRAGLRPQFRHPSCSPPPVDHQSTAEVTSRPRNPKT